MELASSSAAGSHTMTANPWKLLWRANTPPKIRSLTWSLICGIVQTRMALWKKVPIQDSSYVFCHKFPESDFHLFKHLKALELFWMATPLTFNPRSHSTCFILDWVVDVVELISHGYRLIYFMYVCGLFGLRGIILFGKLGVSILCTWLNGQSKCLRNISDSIPHFVKSSKHPLTYWKALPSGWLKVNVDGAFSSETW